MKLGDAIQNAYGAAGRCGDLAEHLVNIGAERLPGTPGFVTLAHELVRMSRQLAAHAEDIENHALGKPQARRGD